MADKKQPKTNLLEELRSKDIKELTQKLAELKKQLVEQQRALAAQELPNASAIGKTRKAIAKLLTVLGEKQREARSKEEEK